MSPSDGAPVELGEPLVEAEGRGRAPGRRGRRRASSSARSPTDRLPAADPAAAAATALRLDDHVAELAGVPLAAAEQPAVGDDAAADADLAEDDQDVAGGAGRRSRPRRWRRGCPRCRSAIGYGASPSRSRSSVADRARRASRGWGEGEHVRGRGRSSPATPTVTPTGCGAAARRGRRRCAAPARRAGRARPPRARACASSDSALLADHVAAEVERERRDVVDVDLGADAADPEAVDLHRRSGAPDRTALDPARPHQPALGQLGHQAGDRRPCSARARPRAVPATGDPGRAGCAGPAPRLDRRSVSWSAATPSSGTPWSTTATSSRLGGCDTAPPISCDGRQTRGRFCIAQDPQA